jgi:predicted O-methyltransferase YrrM
VFDLITNVIEEDGAFYAYHTFSKIREQLLDNNQLIHYKGNTLKVNEALQRYGISQTEGEFLFRLANHYKPKTILAIGSSMGLAPLYLTRYNSSIQCITLESEPDIAHIATQLLSREVNMSFPILTGNYQETIRDSIVQFQQIDCIFMGKEMDVDDLNVIFLQCLPLFNDQTYCVMAGIRSSPEKFQRWKQLCQHPRVTVAVDLFDLGLLFFHSKLHKRVYQTILP